MVLKNHKNVENIKLMNFLLNRNTSKNLDFTYDVDGEIYTEIFNKDFDKKIDLAKIKVKNKI
jgi:hypothetical protein